MNEGTNFRRCRECETVFEPDVADRELRAHLQAEPRCPQCFLSASDPVAAINEREIVIRQSTPFR